MCVRYRAWALVVLFSLVFAINSEAETITQSYDLEITAISTFGLPQIHSINDVFSFSVTYDDNSNVMHVYNQNNDVIQTNTNSNFLFFSDAMFNQSFDLSSDYSTYPDGPLSSYYDFAYSTSDMLFFESLQRYAETNIVNNRTQFHVRFDLLTGTGRAFSKVYRDDFEMLHYEYNVKPSAATPVPEPSTFILLGAGLGGLAIYRRKSKSPS